MVRQSYTLLNQKLQEKISQLKTIPPQLATGNANYAYVNLDLEINEIQREIRAMNILSAKTQKIITDIDNHIVTVPSWFLNNIDWVISGHISQGAFQVAYTELVNQGLVTTPEAEVITDWYWVTKPSGIIERLKISEDFRNRMTAQGWVFSLTEPMPPIITEPEPAPKPMPPIITEPEPIPEIDISITDNMIIQRLDSFSIVNGRAIGQITFTATDSFNPYYYNKNITNIIQFKQPNGANILPFVKQNILRFTATERTEKIQYDEGMNENTRANIESFVWSSVTQPTAFSKQLKFEIVTAQEGQPVPVPTVQTSGFMGAGVAISAIAFSIALGYIIDQRRKK
jgi:hypothetical protein